jgi:plasmid stabilization system protein ParE
MKLRFTPRAAQDLASIAAYIRERNPPAALRVRAAILESLQSLVLFPHIGRQQQVEGVWTTLRLNPTRASSLTNDLPRYQYRHFDFERARSVASPQA